MKAMATIRISTDHPDLTPVFGPLDDEKTARVTELLEQADARLSDLQEKLSATTGTVWKSDGVVLETAVSGQASIDVLIEETGGKVSFALQLRPRNFFPTEEEMWYPGRKPLVMATDAWDIDGSVAVRFKTRVQGRPYTIQEPVAEIAEQRHEDAVAAAEALAARADELVELALSRDPTVDAWRPESARVDGPTASGEFRL